MGNQLFSFNPIDFSHSARWVKAKTDLNFCLNLEITFGSSAQNVFVYSFTNFNYAVTKIDDSVAYIHSWTYGFSSFPLLNFVYLRY